VSRRCPVCGTDFPDEVAFCGHDGNVTIEVQPPGEEPDPRLGEKLGDYIIAAHVADGAMGAVYEARRADTRERVAIKVLHPDVEEDEVAVERFKREYETADLFEHPHIVRVIDFGETSDGQHYMTMEYLVGQELGEVLRNDGAQSPARALRILSQVALALEEAHSFGVIHRDLKPDNVFLCRDEGGDDVRILDFGSVKLQVETGPKLTAFGTTLGSPYYMSPEQAKGLPDVDTRTDVFAMGAILYELLGGQIAFEAPTVAEILMKIVRVMPEPVTAVRPELPAAIDGVIERAIAKDKAERFETPSALVEAALAAFGVEGTVADWASRPEADLAEAVENRPTDLGPPPAMDAPAAAAGPAPQPPAPSAVPAARQDPPPPNASAPIASEAPSAPPAGGGSGNRLVVVAGLAVAAVVVFVGVAAALFLFAG
jgi:serine/threonine-protein kinase